MNNGEGVAVRRNLCPDNNPDNRPVPDHKSRQLRLEDILGRASDTAGATTAVNAWECDTTQKCLNPTVPTPKVNIVGFSQRVYDAARRVQTYMPADQHDVKDIGPWRGLGQRHRKAELSIA